MTLAGQDYPCLISGFFHVKKGLSENNQNSNIYKYKFLKK